MESISSTANDTYKSISAPSEGLYKDNGSKFIALAFPVETEAEIKDIISDVRKKYFDARHHCYAYRLGPCGEKWRANDDGEPSSSAGRPILGQIISNELSDILIVVVRYFGGIKLGVPGLIRAYKESSSDAINSARITTKTACRAFEIDFDYFYMNDIMKIIKDMGAAVVSQDFDSRCSMTVKIRLRDEERFASAISGTGDTLLKDAGPCTAKAE